MTLPTSRAREGHDSNINMHEIPIQQQILTVNWKGGKHSLQDSPGRTPHPDVHAAHAVRMIPYRVLCRIPERDLPGPH